MFQDIVTGYYHAFQMQNLIIIVLGTLVGVALGSFPGLDSSIGAALFIPITYGMNPSQALLLLTALYCGAVYGGQIPAILFRVPGASEAVMTTLDGYPMALKGEAGKALGVGLLSSLVGGIFGVVGLTLTAPLLANVALMFGPSEYFALGILGLTALASLGSKSQIKAIISGLLGLLIATVGLDPITGVPRFVFGTTVLKGGITFIPAVIGLFAAAEVYNQISRGRAFSKVDAGEGKQSKRLRVTFPSLKELKPLKWSSLRSALLGLGVGILPGVGATTAAIVGYSQAVQFSKEPEKFGKGTIEGIIAPEIANNAATGGAMVPLLSLGIPGSATTAIMLAAFLMHGLRPGPLLLVQQRPLAFTIFAGMAIANVLFFFIGFFAIRLFVRLREIPYPFLAVGILAFSAVGANAMGAMHGMIMMFLFAILGFIMEKYNYAVAPMVLGLVLGPIIEPSLRKALMIQEYDLIGVLTRPITAMLLVVSIFVLATPIFWELKRRRTVRRTVN
ncbi:MAG: tripartite tricarboxylate transporter permease [Deltaproteobacteria bacterium]|nr:tripartite tricarboxylate transporter permease [Deltaproteobacteria bacterium]